MKQNKNWWVLQYSSNRRNCKNKEFSTHEQMETFFGTLDETFAFITNHGTSNNTRSMLELIARKECLNNPRIDYFDCKNGLMIRKEKPTNASWCCYSELRFRLTATCLKRNGATDLKKQALLIKKFDELMQVRHKGQD